MMTSEKQPLIRIHGIAPYDRSGKIRWLLTELGIDFENRWLNHETKEYDSLEFLKLNPLGRVPVLEIGGRPMFESGAICAYLADRYLDRGLAPPLSSPERVDYQQWLYFAASTVDTFQTRIMIIEDIPPGGVQAEKETSLLADFRDGLGALDLVLAKNSYLVANRFSAADICVGYHLYWCKLWPEFAAILQLFPQVDSYLERLKNLPSAIKSEVFSYSA